MKTDLKTLAPAPVPPKQFKGRVMRGGAQPGWKEYVERRTAWVEQALEAEISWDEIVHRLKQAGHPTSEPTLRAHRPTSSRAGKGKVSLAKLPKSDIAAVANLIAELVAERLRPVEQELLRLRAMERKYKALKAAFVEESE
jgi:hypothetical protein